MILQIHEYFINFNNVTSFWYETGWKSIRICFVDHTATSIHNVTPEQFQQLTTWIMSQFPHGVIQ